MQLVETKKRLGTYVYIQLVILSKKYDEVHSYRRFYSSSLSRRPLKHYSIPRQWCCLSKYSKMIPSIEFSKVLQNISSLGYIEGCNPNLLC